jgi:hypothetical protein
VLVQDKFQWQAFMNLITNLLVQQKAENFLLAELLLAS